MARGKENANPRSEFQIEIVIGRLDKMHYFFLKEVEEMKDSLVNMARAFDQVEKQCAEVELKMQRKDVETELKMQRQDELLLKAEKKIEDLNKENEQLKKNYLKKCSVELKRMPLMEIQRKKNCTQNYADTVNRPQLVKDVISAPTIGRHNNEDCELPLLASNPVISSEVIVPESTDYLPACKNGDHSFHGNETCSAESNGQDSSVPSGPQFPLPTIQEFTLDGNFDIPGKISNQNPAVSSGDIVPEFIDYIPVYKTEDQILGGDNSARLELAGPSTDVFKSSEEQECLEDLPMQGIKEEQLDNEEVFQAADTDDSSTVDFRLGHNLNEESEWTCPVPTETQNETATVLTIYHCDICQASFFSHHLLQGHRKHHGDRTGLKRHKCPQCAYSTDKAVELRKHIRIHTKERPYVCQVCHKAFTQSCNLNRHMRTHTREKPYVCHLCFKAFSQRNNLHEHMWTHTKEKPYVCDVCQKTFARRSHLNDHMMAHS